MKMTANMNLRMNHLPTPRKKSKDICGLLLLDNKNLVLLIKAPSDKKWNVPCAIRNKVTPLNTCALKCCEDLFNYTPQLLHLCRVFKIKDDKKLYLFKHKIKNRKDLNIPDKYEIKYVSINKLNKELEYYE